MTRAGTSVERSGPLAPVADSFAGQLAALGYVSTGLAGQRALFAHLDRWLGAAGLGVADLTPEVPERFLQARAAEGYATKLTKRGLRPLVDHLENLGLLPRQAPRRRVGSTGLWAASSGTWWTSEAWARARRATTFESHGSSLSHALNHSTPAWPSLSPGR